MTPRSRGAPARCPRRENGGGKRRCRGRAREVPAEDRLVRTADLAARALLVEPQGTLFRPGAECGRGARVAGREEPRLSRAGNQVCGGITGGCDAARAGLTCGKTAKRRGLGLFPGIGSQGEQGAQRVVVVDEPEPHQKPIELTERPFGARAEV
eukprot:scaffold19673_cov112-Isochrysis_galbana.AAC.4